MKVMPPLASRAEIIPAEPRSGEMQDGRSAKYDIIIGKGSTGDDVLAKNPHRLKNAIPGRVAELVFPVNSVNFTGAPSDPAGAVGPNHYVAVHNNGIRIFDKSGNALTVDLAFSNIFGPGSYCCDLTASYDNAADRWVLSILGSGASIAVSDGPNPVTASWYVYDYAQVVDYQKVSVWSNGYYMTDNTSATNKVYVFEREEMLVGNPSAQIIGMPLPGLAIPTTIAFYSPQVLNLTSDDTTTSNATVVYMQDDQWSNVTNDHIKIWTIDIDWDTPLNSMTSAATEFGNAEGVTDFIGTFDGGGFSNLTQPGGSDLDAIQNTVMNQAQFRKFGSHNSAVFNFVVDTDGGAGELAGIRWYELRQDGDEMPWYVYQEGTYTAPDGKHAWLGSMAMDVQGNIGMGYTAMSGPTTPTTVRVSSYYTGRFANDPLGTMTIAEELIQAGDANIPGTRYGDYSKIDVDPANDKKFWYNNELMGPPPGGGTTGRRNVVGVFQIAPDTTNDVGVVSIDTPTTGALSNSETITVTVFNFGEDPASGFDVTYQVDGGSVITEAFVGTLASQTTAQHVFSTTADLSTEGQTYTITSCTDYSIDEDTANDCTNDNVVHVFANDIGVTAITAPETGSFLGDETVTVTIENFGTVDQTGFDVNYIVDGGTPVVETVGVNLPAGGSISYSFAQTVDLSALASYDFTSSTLLVGDSDGSNDTAMSTVVNSACLTLTDTTVQNVGPDGGAVTTSTIYVGNNFAIEDVNVTVDITHTYSGDLTITLTSPDNVEVILSNQNGAGGDNYTNTVFDDDAATSITAGSAPFTGLFQPEGSLADFNGFQSIGEWTLTITDNFGGDGGTLNSWDLELCGNFTLPTNDIGVNLITAPVSGEGLGNETVSITIGNYGTDPASGFDVSYSVDGGTPVVETVAATVNPGSSISYSFATTADLSGVGTYNITASTLLVGDEDTSNNTRSIMVTNLECTADTNGDNFGIGPNAGDITESVITITDDFIISDINVSLNLFHTFDGDLEIKLIGPDFTTEVILSDENGGGGDNYTDTVFDDDADTSIGSGSAPFTGSFVPDGDLNDFNGLSSAGDWKLVITDNYDGDGGALLDWSIQICSSGTLSIDDFSASNNAFDIIYNDNKQYLVKLTTTSINERLDLTVKNVLGQTLLWTTVENETGQGYEYNLDMSYASSGIYFVRIGNNREGYVKRIVVD